VCGSALRQCRATGLTNPLSVCSRPQCCSFAALLLESNLFLSSCAVPGRRRVKARRTDRATHRLSCREARRTDRATYRLSCREATRDQSPGGLDIKCNTCTSTCECHQRVMSATLSDTCPRCCQAASLRALAGWRKWSAARRLCPRLRSKNTSLQYKRGRAPWHLAAALASSSSVRLACRRTRSAPAPSALCSRLACVRASSHGRPWLPGAHPAP